MVDILKLKAKLVERDITQQELSIKMGINPSTLNKKLNDADGIFLSIKEVTNICNILNIESQEILTIFFKTQLEDTQ